MATVSQSAYKPGTTFRYKFKAEPPGTFWYHAHTGVQYANGLRGPLIVQVRGQLCLVALTALHSCSLHASAGRSAAAAPAGG